MTKNNKTIVYKRNIAASASCSLCDKSFENIRPVSLSSKLLDLHVKHCHPEITTVQDRDTIYEHTVKNIRYQ